MSAFKSEEVSRALKRKGFAVHAATHPVYYQFVHEGVETNVGTFMSHNSQDINAHLQSSMARQIGLKVREFQDLIRCPLSHEKLHRILVDRGMIEI